MSGEQGACGPSPQAGSCVPEMLCVPRKTWWPSPSPWGYFCVTSSPFPHSCNLIATTKASLGGSHPMPTILGQPGSLWDWSVRESTVTPQMPCLSSREPSRQGNAKAWEEHSGGVADSTAKPWGTGTSPITASIPETQGQGQLLLRNLMSIRMGLKWTEPLPTRTREGWLGVLHFLPPQLGGSSKHTCLNPFQWTLPSRPLSSGLRFSQSCPPPYPLPLPSTPGCSSAKKGRAVGHLFCQALLLVSQLIPTALQHFGSHPLPH